jgi:hypothetical protein
MPTGDRQSFPANHSPKQVSPMQADDSDAASEEEETEVGVRTLPEANTEVDDVRILADTT